jgi:hypothetical protein
MVVEVEPFVPVARPDLAEVVPVVTEKSGVPLRART